MKVLLLFFIISFSLINNLFSLEGGANQQKIDSLLTELPKHNEDTNRVRILSELSNEYRTKDVEIGKDYGKQALKLAKKLKWSIGEAISYTSISRNYTIKNDNIKAIEYLLRAYEIYNKENIIIDKAITASYLANYYSDLNMVKEGLEYIQIAINYIDEIENKKDLAELYHFIAGYYFNQRENKIAIDYYNKTKSIYEELNDEHSIKQLSGYLATIYLDWGELDLAEKLYKESIEYYSKTGNKYELSNDIMDLSKVYIFRRDYDIALEYLNKALVLKKELNEQFGIATSLSLMGTINFSKKDFNKSEIYLDSALKLYSQIPDSLEMKKTYSNLGLLHFWKLNKKKALDNLFNALKINLNDRNEDLQIFKTLYRTYKYFGAFDSSLIWYEKYTYLIDSIKTDFSQKDIDLITIKNDFENAKMKADKEQIEARNKIIYIASVSALLLLFLIIIYRKNQTKKKLNAQLSEKNSQLIELNELIKKETAEKLEFQDKLYQKELQEKDKELKNLSIELLDKVNAIDVLGKNLKKECNANPEIQAVIMKTLEKTLKIDEDSQKIDEYLNLIYNDFHSELSKKYPDLSGAELKVCTYIKMNKDTKEIADLLRRSPRTVDTHRTNIRKKMNLNSDENLHSIILNI